MLYIYIYIYTCVSLRIDRAIIEFLAFTSDASGIVGKASRDVALRFRRSGRDEKTTETFFDTPLNRTRPRLCSRGKP